MSKKNKPYARIALYILIALIWGAAWYIYDYLNPTITERTTQHPLLSGEETTEQREVKRLVSELEVPRSVLCTSQSRCLIAERPWRIRLRANNELQQEPLLTIPHISNRAEEGLMSMVRHPNYEENGYIYIAYAYTENNIMAVRVVRYHDRDDHLEEERVIIDHLPAARRHAGTALAFGPDGMLYITIGDAVDKQLAQSLDHLHGKIIRITPEGEVPADNPLPWSPIRTRWHRNSQGIARMSNGEMYASEHGPSTFDGPPGGDEINRIIAGENYGWPVVSHERSAPGMRDPIAVYTPAIAPASLYIHDGSVFPQWKDHLFIGMLRWEGVLRVEIDPDNPDQIIDQVRLIDDSYGRVRYVWPWPDGSIIFTTSNEDGRGERRPEGDKVYQIRPVQP